MKAAAKKTARQKKDEKKQPKYVKQLMANAAERKREDDLQFEKKLLREKKEELEEYGDTEKFITSSYRRQMEENKRWIAEKAVRDAEAEKHSVQGRAGTNNIVANILNGRLAGMDEEEEESEKVDGDEQQNAVKEESDAKDSAVSVSIVAVDRKPDVTPTAANVSNDVASGDTVKATSTAATTNAAAPTLPAKRHTQVDVFVE
jgi:coiled-coil domain-containing protein 55